MAFNVLVVDDSAVMRAMIARVVRLSGVPLGEMFEAPNGAEGLRVVREQWVDLVLLDINMPVMNGEEMLAAARRAGDGGASRHRGLDREQRHARPRARGARRRVRAQAVRAGGSPRDHPSHHRCSRPAV